MSTSNGRPTALPDGSSRSLPTTSWYSPAGQGESGVNRQRVSARVEIDSHRRRSALPVADLDQPAGQRLVERIRETDFQSDLVSRPGEARCVQSSGEGGVRSGPRQTRKRSGESAAERTCPGRRATAGRSAACRSFLPEAASPSSCSGFSPRLIRPGSKRSVNRRPSPDQSSSSISRNASTTGLPAAVDQVDMLVRLSPAHRGREVKVKPQQVLGQDLAEGNTAVTTVGGPRARTGGRRGSGR